MPVVKSIPIKLDKKRRLCFDFNSFAELQRECELSLVDLQKFVNIAKVGGTEKAGLLLPFYELRGFIWAGLLDETPDITIREVGKILDDCFPERAGEIGSTLIDALMQSCFFKAAKKKAVRPKIPQKTGAKKTTSKKITN